MAVSIAWALSKLRFPLKPELGGTSPGYIEGLVFKTTGENTVWVSSGAAYIPFAAGGRVVPFNSQTLNFTTGTALGRIHLWLGEENGVGKVFATETEPLTNNYWGSAYKSDVIDGRRYIGSLLRGVGGNVLRCQDDGRTQEWFSHVAQSPFQIIVGNTSQTVQIVGLSSVMPASGYSMNVEWSISTGGPVTRVAASLATTGFTVGSAAFQHSIVPGPVTPMDIAVGSDQIIQYVSDAGSNTTQAVRVLSYKYNR